MSGSDDAVEMNFDPHFQECLRLFAEPDIQQALKDKKGDLDHDIAQTKSGKFTIPVEMLSEPSPEKFRNLASFLKNLREKR